MKKMTLDEIMSRKLSKSRLNGMDEYISSHNIDCSDIPELTADDIRKARRGFDLHPEWYTTKPKKASISLRIDVPTLEKFKAVGKGYQTLMNIVLTEWAERNLD